MFWRVGARGEIVGETAGCGRGQDYQVGGKPSLCGTYLVGSSMEKRRVQLLCWLQLMARGLARMIDLTLCGCCELMTWMLTMQRHRFVAVSVWAHGRDSLRRSGGLSKKQADLGKSGSR